MQETAHITQFMGHCAHSKIKEITFNYFGMNCSSRSYEKFVQGNVNIQIGLLNDLI